MTRGGSHAAPAAARRWRSAPLLLAVNTMLGCAQPPAKSRGELAGELVPPGTPPAQTFDGKAVSLRALRARGPVLLVFLRGFS
jgi:hypothetical protein